MPGSQLSKCQNQFGDHLLLRLFENKQRLAPSQNDRFLGQVPAHPRHHVGGRVDLMDQFRRNVGPPGGRVDRFRPNVHRHGVQDPIGEEGKPHVHGWKHLIRVSECRGVSHAGMGPQTQNYKWEINFQTQDVPSLSPERESKVGGQDKHPQWVLAGNSGHKFSP